jgi:hypothetical protein
MTIVLNPVVEQGSRKKTDTTNTTAEEILLLMLDELRVIRAHQEFFTKEFIQPEELKEN